MHRHAIPTIAFSRPAPPFDDEKLGPLQAALDEIIEYGAPSLGALAAHLLDRQVNFLAVLAKSAERLERWLKAEFDAEVRR
jgi:hypothetical protein